MAKYYSIDNSKGRDTDVVLIFLKDEEKGRYVSKHYKTILEKNYQSFVMLNGQQFNFKELIAKDTVGAVELSQQEFIQLNDKLKDQLC